MARQLFRHCSIRSSLVAIAAVWISTFSSQQSMATAEAKHSFATSKLRVLAKQSFCGSLAKSMESVLGETYRLNSEIAPGHLLALQNQLLKELTQEKGASFIDIAAMTPEQPKIFAAKSETVLPLARILGPAMGLSNQVMLAYTFEELKYLPFSQMGSQILLITSDANSFGLNNMVEERLRLVEQTAQKLGVKISLLNLSSGKLGADAMAALASLATSTGGHVVTIDASQQGCGKLL